MWYKNVYRRHLCDMHIDDWDESFLSQLSPEDYVENLKLAKIQSAMIYVQSHVGLCFYPTKSGKMHNAFVGKEDMIKHLTDLCRENNINVVVYYSLNYNNWAHDNFPKWRMVDQNGQSQFQKGLAASAAFADSDVFRYGLCCPNNTEYREFVSKQIKEICEYFTFDGVFFDMTFWPQVCYCDHCKKRWETEVGGKMPELEDWNDPTWLKLMRKRSEWMGEYAQSVTNEVKSYVPEATVSHNYANSAQPDNKGSEEAVNEACDYVGGDLYGDIYRHSFTRKFFRGITKNQPFEYMLSRCTPKLSVHTVTKSDCELESAIMLTAAHHGATLVIDAIDPVGTMDRRVYEQVGRIFEKQIPFEKYFTGDMIEDIGIFYSLKSKFNRHKEGYTNHLSSINMVQTFISKHIPCGVTGSWRDLNKHKIIVAPCLTEQDEDDNKILTEYVSNGGCLYLSGADNEELLRLFFNADFAGRTEEKVVYISPREGYSGIFSIFNQKYPMPFEGTAPIASSFEGEVIATLTMPYTKQNVSKFASIHSNPPHTDTDFPAIIYRNFGKGTVVWSALPIESVKGYHYRNVFCNLLDFVFKKEYTVYSDACKDIEIVCFNDKNSMQLSAVYLVEDDVARKIPDFEIKIHTEKVPKAVCLLPDKQAMKYSLDDNEITIKIENFKMFKMIKIDF